jgi:hypothetical protein
MPRLHPLADVLQFRRESAETSGRYRQMSDAELDYEALKRAKDEVFADAQQAAIEMQQAQQRMNRHLDRYAELKGQIEIAGVLLEASRG